MSIIDVILGLLIECHIDLRSRSSLFVTKQIVELVLKLEILKVRILSCGGRGIVGIHLILEVLVI